MRTESPCLAKFRVSPKAGWEQGSTSGLTPLQKSSQPTGRNQGGQRGDPVMVTATLNDQKIKTRTELAMAFFPFPTNQLGRPHCFLRRVG